MTGARRRCRTQRVPEEVCRTLDAADQVACEFLEQHRVEFLTQAITREHPRIDATEATRWARAYVAAA